MHNTDWHVVGIDSFRHKGWCDRVRAMLDAHPDWAERLTVIVHDLTAPFSPLEVQRIGPVDYIISMAALSDVQASIDDPVPFVTNNVQIALTMLEYARLAHPEVFIQISTDEVYGPSGRYYGHPEWSPILPSNPYSASKAAQECLAIAWWRSYGVPLVLTNCFDTKTRMLTLDGFKGVDELTEQDQVWSMDDDGNMLTVPVLEKVRMPGPSKMVRFRTRKVDQLVTPNHRMMVRKAVGKPRRWGALEVQLAADLVGAPGRNLIPTNGTWAGSLDAWPDYAKQYDPTLFAEMLGWYVSEGYKAGTKGVCFGAGRETQKLELEKLLTALGLKNHRSGRSVRTHDGALSAFIDTHLPGLAASKALPRWLLDSPPDILEVFWEAAMAGDGAGIGVPGAQVYYTKSAKLSEHMAEVGMKIGYSVRIDPRETWNPRKTKKVWSWIVRFRCAGAGINAEVISEEDYAGEVWCVRTPTGRVFVERNGIVSLSGQTMNNFGEMQQDQKFPVIVQKLVEAGQVVQIHGEPGDVGSRHYLHSRNFSDALLWIIRNTTPTMHEPGKIDRPDRYNIVGDAQLDNLELAKTIARLMECPLEYDFVGLSDQRPGHDNHYGLDGSKLSALGWSSPVSFEDSLAETIRWQQANPEWIHTPGS